MTDQGKAHLTVVDGAPPPAGVGTRYLELVAQGMPKEQAARQALDELAAARRAAPARRM